MIWAILALLGVPLWLCALGILVLVLRNRSLRRRSEDIPCRVRAGPDHRWRRGHGTWVHDVFAFRASPAGWNVRLDWVESGDTRPPAGREVHQLRHLTDPTIATFALADGGRLEVAVPGEATSRLLGPVPQARPAGPAVPPSS
jgi:hypothetical protein